MIVSFFKKIAKPFLSELPFIVILMVLIGYRNFYTLAHSWGNHADLLIVSKSFLVIFLIAYLLGCIVYLLKKNWLRWVILAFATILFVIDIFLKVQFEMTMCPQVLSLIGETTDRESKEFLAEYVFSWTGILTVVGGLCFLVVYWLLNKTIHFKKYTKRGWICGLIVFILCLGGAYHVPKYFSFYRLSSFEDLEMWEAKVIYRYKLDTFSKLFFSIYTLKYAGIETTKAIAVSKQASNANVQISEDSLNIVLVIGESFNKYHSNLYGYYLNTTPTLSAEKEKGNLFVFNDAISTWNMTSKTLKNLFCTNSIMDGETWSHGVFFPALYKKAGFNVYSWDNQRSFSPNSMATYSMDAFLFSPEICSLSYSQTNEKCFQYDDELILDLENQHFDNLHNNLFIIHLMGQHQDVAERFPQTDEYIKFTKSDIQRSENWVNDDIKDRIAVYDNAICYGDRVLKHVIDIFSQYKSIIVFLSDHGGEFYDYRRVGKRTGGSDDIASFVKYAYDVPFVIWCSDTYKQTHPDIIEDIQRSLDNKFMSDNLCQVLFHISRLQNKYYIPERDLLSKEYVNRPRVLGNRLKYDYIREKSLMK